MISRPNFAALFSLLGLLGSLSLLAGSAQIAEAQVPLPDPRSIVSLSSTVIDINLPEPGLPPDLLVSPDGLVDGYYLVKFSDPASASERHDLETLADRVYTYLPYYSYLVKMPKALATSATVTSIGASWVGDYHPGYKLSPHVAQIAADGSSERRIVMLHVYPDADLTAVQTQIAALGIDGLVGSGTGSFFSRARLLMTADEIAARRNDLARLRDVFWVDVEGRITLHNDTTVWVGQSGTTGGGATPVFDNGIFGAGQVIGVLDTGLDPDMCYFADGLGELPAENNCNGGTAINPAHRKVLAIDFLWTDDCDGTTLNKYDNQSHGTHVAGTALGDDSATPIFHDPGDGMAPAAKLIVQDGGFATDDCADLPALGCPVVDLKPFLQQAFDQGARIHTNSWGDDENNPVQRLYTTGTQDFDQFMWENKDFLLMNSAGNSGTTGAGAPSTGKNVVGVGSTLRGASADSMSSFSSHGPTDDGRIKPDITVPGSSIVSASADVNVNVPGNCGTSSKSGTSMSSPGGAGLAALAREYFTAGWYPSAAPTPGDAFTPSAALLKAALVNSAVSMTNEAPIPSNHQGWGRVLLDNVLEFPADTRKLWVKDETTGFPLGSSGAETSFQFSVSAGEPFKVTLAWVDFPSTPAANPHINNDLDLRVEGPDGTYLGNVFAGGASVTGGSSNRLDTVEQVLVASPTPGLYTVVVSSFNVPDGPQPYGLVVTGAMSEEGDCSSIPASAAVESAGLTLNSGDGDDFLDNCENADLALTMTNNGGVDLTNVRITSIGSPSHPAVAFNDGLPIAVASPITAGCGGPRGSSTASFNFTARGLAHDEELVFEVEIDADELTSPITAILTISDLEVDLELVPEVHFDFEDSTEEWQVQQGTFTRTNNPPPGAETTSFYFASSSATSDQCDQVRSPRLRLSSTSTLTLWNQFGTEPGSVATGFYDRANAGLIDADTGVRVTIEPDGGLRPYNVPAGTPAGSCVAENQAGWAGPGPGWLDATWSAGALGVSGLPVEGGEFFLDITYGTDALVEGTGFWFDQVTVTDVLAHAEDEFADVCLGINNGPEAVSGGIFTEQNTSAPITLDASDPDGDALSFTVLSGPANGTLTGTAPNLIYTPGTDYVGPDSLEFEACDAELCDQATTTITVIPAGIPIPCTAGFAGAYPCSNVDLLGVMPSGVLVGGTGNPSSGSDLWGWTDPLTGREYAVQGLSNSVAFVDVTAPTEPVFVGHLPAPVPNVLWRDLKVYNNHAYIVGDFSPLAHGDPDHPEAGTRPDNHGIQIFDLTRLRGVGPVPEIFTHDAVYLGPPGQPSLLLDETHNIVINEETGFAYAVASNTCGGGMHMLDLKNDPLVPEFVGCWDDAGINVHDAQCVIYTGPDTEHQGQEICMNANEDFFDIVDVTDKNAPVRLARRTYFGQSYIHQGWFTEDQAYFVSGDETDELFNGPHNTFTYIWDVRDLDNPIFLNTYEGPSLAIDHNIYIRSCFVFQANYTAGFRVLDTSDVANGNLTEIGYFDTHAEDGGVDLTVFAGAWSNYPFFASGNVIVGNIEDGNLFILRPHLKPKAKDQEVTTPEDIAVAITLEAEDINQQAQTWSIVSGPDHGTLSGTAPDLVYTPDANYNGPDSFVFEACDPDGLCDQGTVSITVTPVNDAPVAVDDSSSTSQGTALMVAAPGVLANDSDVDGDALSASLVGTTSNGVLMLMMDGGFTYTPDPSFCGADDTFTYTASDGEAASNVATVAIFVSCTGDNQPPTADDQSVSTDEDTAVAIVLTGSDPDGDPLTYSIISSPSNGSLSGIAPNLTYTPTADFNGADAFTFQVCDDGSPQLCDQGTVTITVNPVNDAPTAADDAYAASEGVTLSIGAPGVLGNDGDVDGDSLSATLASDVANGTLMLAADGSFTYTPDAGFCGADDSFTYRANDGDANSNLATVTIAVSCGPNQAPVADDQLVETDEDTAVAITLTGSDPDGDTLTYTVLDRPTNGTLSGTPPSLVYTPDPDYNGPDSFTFEVCDAEFCDSATVSITVYPVNDFPIANGDADSTLENTAVTIDVLANDSDPDGDPLAVGSVTQGSNGMVTNNGTDVTYTPDAGFSGVDSFDYEACDPAGACDTASITVVVREVAPPCDYCNDGDSDDPVELDFTYFGGDCSNSDNTQGSKAECTDFAGPPPSDQTVFIVGSNKEDADNDSDDEFFRGPVDPEQAFMISAAFAGKNDLPSKVFIHIFDADTESGGVLLQTNEVHTSCSAPMIEGERFGAVQLGDAANPGECPAVSSGRVHGSGHLNVHLGPGDDEDSDTDADSDSDDDSDSDKLHFSFDAKVKNGALKGKLKLKDKEFDIKIDADKDGITSLSTGTGECNGQPLGPNSWEFTAVGTFERDDLETSSTFRVCGEDNGKPGKGNDRFYLECTSGCSYDTGSRVPDDVIDGGNIHIHDAISNGGGGAFAGSSFAEPGSQTSAKSSTSAIEASGLEPDTDIDVLELGPMLLDEVPAGTQKIFVVALFTDEGLALVAREITLTWTDASGTKQQATALTDGLGVAAFAVTVPAGGTEFFATADGVQSNGAYVTGTSVTP